MADSAFGELLEAVEKRGLLLTPVGRGLRMASESLRVPPEASEEVKAARSSLLAGVEYWAPYYRAARHHIEIADTLERVYSGEIPRLIVLAPPRHGKSELVSRQFPAWVLGQNPNEEIILGSYGQEIASSMAIDVQKILALPRYREVYPMTQLADRARSDTPVKRRMDEFRLMGYRGGFKAGGLRSGMTGFGCTLGLIDDDIKNREQANSSLVLERNWAEFTGTFRTRGEGQDRWVVTATPWTIENIAGRLIQQMLDGGEEWAVLRYQAIREKKEDPENIFVQVPNIAKDDREEGESLWPEKFTPERLRSNKQLSTVDWESLFQQRPAGIGGAIFKRRDFRRYDKLPTGIERWLFSVDCAFKDSPNSDNVAIGLWGVKGSARYRVNEWVDRMAYPDMKKLLRNLLSDYHHVRTILIEEKANGSAVIEELKRDGFVGIKPINPTESKSVRALGVLGIVEAGDVWVPQESDWVETYLSELAAFPTGKHDDRVDETTQLLSYLQSGSDPIEYLRLLNT